jgi:hypothetical protein
VLGSLWSVDDDATANFMHGFTPTCLERMPAAKRELLHSYYAWAGTEKIAHHRQWPTHLVVGKCATKLAASRPSRPIGEAGTSLCQPPDGRRC